jgi:hypothetical protein
MPEKLIQQAIIDANDLRESAMKVAQTAILEKHAVEVREHFDQLIEQDEEDILPMDDEAPMDLPGPEMGDLADDAGGPVHPVVEELPLAAQAKDEFGNELGDDDPVEIDIDDLTRQASQGEFDLDAMADLSDDPAAEKLPQMDRGKFAGGLPAGSDMDIPPDQDDELMLGDEEDDFLQELANDLGLFEELEVPEVRSDGFIGADEVDFEEEEALKDLNDKNPEPLTPKPHLTFTKGQVDELLTKISEQAIAEFDQAIQHLQKKNSELKKQNVKMKTQISEVNLSNARLLYTNRVLTNPSLNERQRKSIVEMIGKCESVKQAKFIYEKSLNQTGLGIGNSPRSLNEAAALNDRYVSAAQVINGSKQASKARLQDSEYSRMARLADVPNE